MYWVVLVLAWVGKVHGECHFIQCATLATGVCAENNGQAMVSVNRAGCQNSGYCSYQMFDDWLNNQVQRDTQLMCSQTSSLLTVRAGDTSCPTRQVQKDLLAGTSTLIQCETPSVINPECQLQDGTYTECVCALNGKSYCVPHISSTVFDDYWAECFKSGKNYGYISDDDHYWYWYYRIHYYLPYLTAYSCARSFFEEFTKIDDLMYTHAVSIVLGLTMAF